MAKVIDPLPVPAVDAWIQERVPGLTGPPDIEQFRGGASNWTYGITYPERSLVLRRPPAGTKAKSAHDMGREHGIQAALRPSFPYVPQMVGHCTDEAVLGSEFYVMERLDGLIPRARMPKGVELSPEQARQLCEHLLDTLVALHGVDATQPALAALNRGAGYARRQVDGWTRRYADARTPNVPRCAYVMDYLRANVPDDVASCVIHGDYRLDNVVLDRDDPTRIVGVLDWELATVGDPLMDLGSSLTYWIQADDDRLARSTKRQPSDLPGMLTRDEMVARYADKAGRAIDDFTFYEVFGLFRLAAIAQQIYYRHYHGQVRRKEFRILWVFVHYLNWRARRLIKRSGG